VNKLPSLKVQWTDNLQSQFDRQCGGEFTIKPCEDIEYENLGSMFWNDLLNKLIELND